MATFPSSYPVCFNNFLKASESNKLVAKVSGKRKLYSQGIQLQTRKQKINTFINQNIFLDVIYTLEQITVTTFWHKKSFVGHANVGLTKLYSSNVSLYKQKSRWNMVSVQNVSWKYLLRFKSHPVQTKKFGIYWNNSYHFAGKLCTLCYGI